MFVNYSIIQFAQYVFNVRYVINVCNIVIISTLIIFLVVQRCGGYVKHFFNQYYVGDLSPFSKKVDYL